MFILNEIHTIPTTTTTTTTTTVKNSYTLNRLHKRKTFPFIFYAELKLYFCCWNESQIVVRYYTCCELLLVNKNLEIKLNHTLGDSAINVK